MPNVSWWLNSRRTQYRDRVPNFLVFSVWCASTVFSAESQLHSSMIVFTFQVNGKIRAQEDGDTRSSRHPCPAQCPFSMLLTPRFICKQNFLATFIDFHETLYSPQVTFVHHHSLLSPHSHYSSLSIRVPHLL